MSRYRTRYKDAMVVVDASNLEAAAAEFVAILGEVAYPIECLWEGDEPEDQRLRRLGAMRLPGLEV
ncbi:MAG: hypothetical protein Q7O66_07490 [Dehalococcoidia bacterium]|nr:hypothetical protein [Dehalococcoidia bacterium]